MQNFMVDTLTTSSHSPQGCGMSTRPGYYSGRGATQTDLDSTKLEKIYQSILKNKGKVAGNAFVRMVESIKVMSATNFLIALEDLDACDYRLNGSAKMPAQDGISIENEGEAIGTIMSVFAGS